MRPNCSATMTRKKRLRRHSGGEAYRVWRAASGKGRRDKATKQGLLRSRRGHSNWRLRTDRNRYSPKSELVMKDMRTALTKNEQPRAFADNLEFLHTSCRFCEHPFPQIVHYDYEQHGTSMDNVHFLQTTSRICGHPAPANNLHSWRTCLNFCVQVLVIADNLRPAFLPLPG